ncbi:family 1 glycosylhydrolase [Actinomadura kijaniata]|uniref:family 1 glycosylhydrolase n=1 Tax=Actinomadura kijaniata TaxID=46161 RepID=UPI003F19E92F
MVPFRLRGRPTRRSPGRRASPCPPPRRASARRAGRRCGSAGVLVGSLLDNFEWVEGHVRRFGIVPVGFAGQRRLPGDGAPWFRGVLARDGIGGKAR